MFSVVCPHCEHKQEVPDDAPGKTWQCRHCRRNFDIPEQREQKTMPETPESSDAKPRKAAPPGKKLMGALLTETGLISSQQLEDALRIQREEGGKIADILIAQGYLSRRSYLDFLARQPGTVSLDLLNYAVPFDMVSVIPKSLALKHEVFPLDRMGKLLTIAMACPLDMKALQEIEEVSGLKVKPMLCSAADVRAAIRRYYPGDEIEEVPADAVLTTRYGEVAVKPLPADSARRRRSVSWLLTQLHALPALPETVHRLREAMTDMTVSVRDVADMIILDPPIAAKVLSVANSAAYGFPNRVATVDLAVSLLGLRETYSIVLAGAVINLFEKYSAFNYELFWMHAMCCAGAAKAVAKACDRERSAGVFTAALLHDIGRVALMEVAPDLYGQVDPELEDEALLEAEKSIVGLNHAEAGQEVAGNWGLPNEIIETIAFHHAPEHAVDAKETVAIVAIADELTRENGLRDEEDADAAVFDRCATPFAILGLSAGNAERLLRQLASVGRARYGWARKWKEMRKQNAAG